jgi:hypothetical protein
MIADRHHGIVPRSRYALGGLAGGCHAPGVRIQRREPALSDDDYDQPRRRSNTAAVLLALVFLTILGAMTGVILGTARGGTRNDNVANQSPAASSPGATVTETATAEPTGTRTSTNTRSASPSKSYRPTRKDTCPQQTEEAARTDLTVKLYIRTADSEVWICEGGGRVFYQGHRYGKPFPSATSDYSLFIPDPHYEGGVWAATNGSTVYYVSAERLRREKDGHQEADDPVKESYGG